MSCKITFPTLAFLGQQANQNERTKLFQLFIYNEQWKQDIKVYFNNSIDASIQLPKNLFVLNVGDHFTVQIQEKGVSKIEELDNKLETGNIQVLVDKLGIREANGKVKQGQIDFQTESKMYKVVLQFKAIYEENKVFSGYFCGLLKNQGDQLLNFQSMKKNTEINQNFANQHSLKQLQQQIEKKVQVPRKSAVWAIKNPLICCTQPTQDEQQVADEQLPSHISQKLSRKLITRKSRSQIQEMIPNSDYKNQTAQTTQTKTGSAFRPREIEEELKDTANQDKVVQLYRGSCKSKNFFSCGDEDYDGQEICILQPVYRNKN